MSAVVAVLLLAVSAWPLGRRLAAALPPAASPACRIATEILAGLIVQAGLVHVLVCIGVPLKGAFGFVGAVGVGAAVIGPTPAARGSSPLPRMFGPLVALVIVVTASAPLVEGLHRAPRRNDAEFIWLPKAERLFDEIPPIPWSAPEHAHAEYPRGWPALVAAAGAFDQPVPDEAPNVVGVLFMVLVLLSIVDAAASRGRPWAGLAAAAVLGLNPEWSALACSGLADLPLSAALLLVVMATPREDDGAPLLAVAAAFGAACLKDEGWVLLVAVGVAASLRAVRTRSPRPLVASAIAWALLVPWLVLRAPVGSRTTLLVPWLPENAGWLFRRIAETAKELLHMGFGDGTTYPEFPGVAAGSIVVFTAVVAASGAALVCGGPFKLRTPAILGLAAFAVWCVTPDPLRWHVWTSADRIACQLAPAVLLAGFTALWPPRQGAVGGNPAN